jgi:hypothetical protein
MTARDAVAPAVVALLCYVLLHWRGIGLDPDSWAAWQAAISIVAGNGYTYFSGNPIHSWPPLYPLYLAAWISALGPAVWTLLISNAVLVVLQSVLWLALVQTLARESGVVVSATPSIAVAIFIGLFVALNEQSVFAHNLVYTLLPAFLLGVWRLVAPRPRPITLANGSVLVALATAMLLTHSSAGAFVAAAAAVLLIARRDAREAWLLALLLVALPVLVWSVVHVALDQLGSQPIGLGQGRHSPLVYALQLLDGPGSLLVPAKFRAQFFAILLLWAAALALAGHPGASGLRFGIAIVAISQLMLFALFNLSWVYPSIVGRFVLFVPLLLVPLAFLTAWPAWPRWAMLALVLATVPTIYWTASWSYRQQSESLAQLGFPGNFMPPYGYISRDYRFGPNVQTDRGLLIAPSPWEETKGLKQ